MTYETTAMKVEFRIPGFYSGDGMLIADGFIYGILEENLLIIGSDLTDKEKGKMGIEFSLYYQADPEEVKRYDFVYDGKVPVPGIIPLTGSTEEGEIVSAVMTLSPTFDLYAIWQAEKKILKRSSEISCLSEPS